VQYILYTVSLHSEIRYLHACGQILHGYKYKYSHSNTVTCDDLRRVKKTRRIVAATARRTHAIIAVI